MLKAPEQSASGDRPAEIRRLCPDLVKGARLRRLSRNFGLRPDPRMPASATQCPGPARARGPRPTVLDAEHSLQLVERSAGDCPAYREKWRMRALGRIAAGLGAAMLAAAAPASARADGCTVDDLWNAIESTASAITSGACAAACADTAGAGCTAAAGSQPDLALLLRARVKTQSTDLRSSEQRADLLGRRQRAAELGERRRHVPRPCQRARQHRRSAQHRSMQLLARAGRQSAWLRRSVVLSGRHLRPSAGSRMGGMRLPTAAPGRRQLHAAAGLRHQQHRPRMRKRHLRRPEQSPWADRQAALERHNGDRRHRRLGR